MKRNPQTPDSRWPGLPVQFVRAWLRLWILCACLWGLAGGLWGKEIPIVLLHTADVHGHLAAVMSDRESEPGGGLLRCASVIRSIRAQEPNVLLLDCGDLVLGSPDSWLTRGEGVAAVVEGLRYDALVLGNHEFDGGWELLKRFYRRVNRPVLACNIGSPVQGVMSNALPLKPFILFDVQGIKIAVVGLTNPNIPRWFLPSYLGGLTFEASVPALRRILPEVKQARPDVLVLAAHQGLRRFGDDPANEMNAVARAFPEFDVILGAHTHETIKVCVVCGVPFTQSGYSALSLGRVRLTVDSESRRILRKEMDQIPVNSTLAPDPALTARCESFMQQTARHLKQVVGRSAHEHRAKSKVPGQSEIQTLLCQSMAEAVRAPVAMHGAFADADLPEGRILMRHIWKLVPYENAIGVLGLTEDEIRTVLEENGTYYQTPQFRGVYGLTYEFDPKASAGHRVGAIRLADRCPIPPGERIRVAFNSFDLASAGGRFPCLRALADHPQTAMALSSITTRDAVVAFVRAHQPLDVAAAPGMMRPP